jgi:hypothetical protein
MGKYLISDDMMLATSYTPNENIDLINTTMQGMLDVCGKINLGDEIISEIKELQNQYVEAKANKLIGDVSKFDARLFFKLLDIITVVVTEENNKMKSKLFDQFYSTEDDGEDTEEPVALFPEGYEDTEKDGSVHEGPEMEDPEWTKKKAEMAKEKESAE